jgi:hypothetical protein
MKKILQKLHKIQTEVEKMEKDGYNDFQNYNYLSETQVTLKIKKLLDENKVIFNHSSQITNVITFQNAKGLTNFLTNILVKYSFYDIESGEKMRGEVCGQGTDSGDKGVYKAITGAIKYIFMKNFLIPTGDDPENEKQTSRPTNRQTYQPKANQQFKQKQEAPKNLGVCQKCGAEMVYNPKTGNNFCKDKCWLNKKQEQPEEFQDDIKIENIPF